jgi:hypothetical protein
MFFDKKKSVSVILSKLGKDGQNHESEVAHEGGDHDEYTSLAEDIISATKEGSVQRLAQCLKSFHEMIEEADEAQDQEE